MKVLSGNFIYITVHARTEKGYWIRIYRGAEKELEYGRYFKKYAEAPETTHFIFQLNGSYERFDREKCEAALYRVQTEMNAPVQDEKKDACVSSDKADAIRAAGKKDPEAGEPGRAEWTMWTDGKNGTFLRIPKDRLAADDALVFEATEGFISNLDFGAVFLKTGKIIMTTQRRFSPGEVTRKYEVVIGSSTLKSRLASRYWGDFVFVVNGRVDASGNATYNPVKSRVNVSTGKPGVFSTADGYDGELRICRIEHTAYGIYLLWKLKNGERCEKQKCRAYVIFSRDKKRDGRDILKDHKYYNGGSKNGGISSKTYLMDSGEMDDHISGAGIASKYGEGTYYFQVIMKDGSGNIIGISNIKKMSIK